MRRFFVGLVILTTVIQGSTIISAQESCCDGRVCDVYGDCAPSGCDACDDCAGSCLHDDGLCDRWFQISRSLEDCGINSTYKLSTPTLSPPILRLFPECEPASNSE